MAITTGSGTLNKDLEFIASKGAADLSSEGLAPSTTDSMLQGIAESDRDSVGEDTNTPEALGMNATALPSAMGSNEAPERNASTISTKRK